MSEQQQKTRAIKDAEQAVARTLRQIGPSEAVSRFMSRYAKVRTQKAYCTSLLGYLKWMKSMKSVSMTPDELVRDNLRCVYGSAPEDVATKRRHADWLNEYVNVYMISKNASEAWRTLAFAAVKEFYKKNDSPLFGDIGFSLGQAQAPPKALHEEDIRKVLHLLPLNAKLPLLIEWQSGMEINRVLGLKWKEVEEIWKGEQPLRIELFGRKSHRRGYHTFLGRDSVELLKVWLERWEE